ncbi:hypothetical protein C2S51_005329 [Perilla frutescens var. frutescens]|nr:hypothetical protein C2S51_005329 [Perilla frutescens var. frutescens]
MIMMTGIGESRFLRLNYYASDELMISDGRESLSLSVSSCRHQYGFLPCAENGAGYLFMIVVYQVLLIVGDMLIGSGSEVLFYITGAEFGGILFRILRALPSMTLMILSGIFSDKEHAQSQVSVVVGVYAGITVFSLTVQWFMCMVSASKSLKEKESKEHAETSHSNCFPLIKEKLRIFVDHGVKVDKENCKTAGIMLLSLLPYVVLQLVYAFNTSSGKRFMTLVALTVSSLFLISYFVYQIRNPWMQKRSLNYSKFDIVQRGFMQHVERLGKLVKEDGTLDINLIKEFFDKADKDDDRCIAVEEMEKLVCEVFKAGKTDIDQNNAVNQVMNKFDNDQDKRITEEEFLQGFKQWIHEAKHSASDINDVNPTQMFHKAFQLLKENKENMNSPNIDQIMSKILKQAEGQLMRSEALITHNGEPNIERIQSLFREFDTSGDGSLSETELKQLISRVKFGTYQMKDDEVIKEMFRVFDQDNNDAIDEQEFIRGVKGYLEKAMKAVNTSERTRVIEEFDKIVWKEVVYTKQDFFKSVFQVLLGIAMLTFLAGPLMENILQLSNAMNFPSFIISFVVVPIAMNARAAIAALLPASKKREDTASLTFSEVTPTPKYSN